MNNDNIYLNDTLDCLTFFENANHIKNFKEESDAKSNTTEDSTKEIKCCNISVDDSTILNEFLSSYEQHKKSLNVSTCSSEELFADSPVRSLKEDSVNDTGDFSHEKLSNSIPTCNVALIQQEGNGVEDKSTILSLKHTKNGTQKELFNDKYIQLSSWDLPEPILQKYQSRGIGAMFPWQAECLNNLKVLGNNANLIYSAPTSAGKTLVAEILSIKTVLERRKKVLFILPFISVVREKMFYFQDLLVNSGIRVEGFMGSYNPPGGFNAVQIAICTIEKANGIINKLLEENTLSEVGAVVIDEMHLLGDSSRGYLLELMLTKLLYMSTLFENVNIQIIGMSATLPNLSLLGKWLKAELYITSFRPIPLYEQCLVENEIYDKDFVLQRHLSRLPELDTDSDHILQLCLETIRDSCSVLIFCPTKNWCENLAQQISSAFWKLGCLDSPAGLLLRKQLNSELIAELLEQLKRCSVGLDKILQKTVSFGVAFHHAGLTMDERDIIEGAFRNGALRILVATSTLSSGVNLPARRVIIRTPIFHGKPIDNLVYHQMIGRAGRMGRDSCGESILICRKTESRIAKELLTAELKPIESCLEETGRLSRAILEIIASGVAKTPEDVNFFINCTLLAASQENINDQVLELTEAVDFLQRNEFIRLQQLEDESSKYVSTALGKACLSSSMPPEEGLALFAELEKARQCFVLESELHLVYLVTPYSVCNQWTNFDWMLFLELWEKLSSSMKKVGELVGVRESYIINASRNKIQTSSSKLYHKLQIHRRFFTALALQDLVNEVPLNDVAAKFGCARGMLQSLQQSSSTFAGMLTIFCRQLGWSAIELLISQFQDRLQFGVSRDLLDLMRLPILNGPRARALYNAGIETLVHLAASNACTIESALHKIAPFESEKERDGESKFAAQKRNELRTIWITGKAGLTEREASAILIKDARRYLQLELGLTEAKWESSKQTVTDSSTVQELSQTTENLQNVSYNNRVSNSDVSEISSRSSVSSNSTNSLINSSNDKLNLSCSFELQLSKFSISSPQNSTPNRNFLNSTNSNFKSKFNSRSVTEKGSFNTSEQSLFEKSFEINKKFSECIISNSNSPEKHCYNSKNSDSGLDFENGSFLESAFVFNSFETKKSETRNNPELKIQKVNFDESLDSSSLDFGNCFDKELVVNSQGSSPETPSRSLLIRKRKKANKETVLTKNCDQIDETPSKKRKLNTSLKCKNIFSGNGCIFENSLSKSHIDSFIDLTELHVVDVCSNVKLFQTFSSELLEKRSVSVSLACTTFNSKPLIGMKVFQNSENLENADRSQQFVVKNRKITGCAFMWGTNIAYYVSFENTSINNSIKLEMLDKLFSNKNIIVRVFESKEQIKILKKCFDLNFCAVAEDPKVADWLMEPDDIEKNLQGLVAKYAPEVTNLLQLGGYHKKILNADFNVKSNADPRIRACIEAVATWYLCESLNGILIPNHKLLKTYNLEMKITVCLSEMECTGFGVDISKLQSLADNLKDQIKNLEKEAYYLAGRKFSFTSSSDVAKVLRIHRGRKVSITKQILEKQENPIATIILQWRKISGTLTKMIYPLIRAVENDKIYCCSITHNSTGRISMQEPNLQNVPKNFTILNQVISCRDAFVPEKNKVFLSADYCQLELRLLAHFCKDSLLCSIMNSHEDIFRCVAAKWKNIRETEVDDVQRQWAKQICYGIIYGMGAKALSEKLLVTETEATNFMDSFRSCYPNIQVYIQETINKCQDVKYVQTLAGRRRYLPNINHQNISIKRQAERQAVNTTIQGSAADIAKLAMVSIDYRFREKFRHPDNVPKLVLHLHDELLYEVREKYLLKTARILKKCMEEVVNLSVPFPVKLKSGLSWGTMKELAL